MGATRGITHALPKPARDPGDVGDFGAIGGVDGAFADDFAGGHQPAEQNSEAALEGSVLLAMRAHNNLPMTVEFDLEGQVLEPFVVAHFLPSHVGRVPAALAGCKGR